MPLGSLLARTHHPNTHGVRIGGRLQGKRLCVPVLSADEEVVRDHVLVATTLIEATQGEVHLLDPIEEETRLISMPADRDSLEEAIVWATEGVTSRSTSQGVLGARRVDLRLRNYLTEGSFDTLVLPGGDETMLSGSRLRRLAKQAPCNVITVNGKPGFREFASILLPIANGPHSGLATDVAGTIAREIGAWVDILHVISPDANDRERRAATERTETAAERIDLPERASTWVLEESDTAEAIVDQSAYYGLTVIGAPTAGPLHRFVYGSTSQSIRHAADSVVIAARTTDAP